MQSFDLFPRNTELLLSLYQAHEDRISDDFVKIPAKWLLNALQKANLEMIRIKNSEHFALVWNATDYVAIPTEMLMDRPFLLSKTLDLDAMVPDDNPLPPPTKPGRRSAVGKGKTSAGKGEAGVAKGKASARKRS